MGSFFSVNNIIEKKIICFGAGQMGRGILNDWYINHLKYNIIALTDNDSSLYGIVIKGNERSCFKQGVNVISVEKAVNLAKSNSQILIVITVQDIEAIEDIKRQLAGYYIENSIIEYSEFKALVYREVAEHSIIPISNQLGYDLSRIFWYNQEHTGQADYDMHDCYKGILDYYRNKKTLACIFSPYKVGNSTLLNSCQKMGLHLHMITSLGRMELAMYPEERELISECIPKFVVGVREPVAQHISLLYQLAAVGYYPRVEGTECRNADKVFDKLFIKNEGADDYAHLHQLNEMYRLGKMGENGWESRKVEKHFDINIKQGLGWDVYDYEFDKERGYSIIKRYTKIGLEQQILVYKLEKMNDLEDVFSEFFEVPNFKLYSANVAERKWYQESYKKFKKEVRLPRKYIENLYESIFMKHFYTESEIQKFWKKWSANIKE